MARAPDFDLATALASPSFTAAQRDAPALVELIVGGEESVAAKAAAALVKVGDAGRRAIEARLAGGGAVGGDTAELSDAATARLVGALGLFARGGDAAATGALLARVGDPHVRVRRAAISALGKLGGDEARRALVVRWDADDVAPDERRTLVEALGKIGGDDVLERLRALDAGDDAELQRRRQRAQLMIERSANRAVESTVRIDRAPPHALPVLLRCKAGLVPLLAEELTERGFTPMPRGDAAVEIRVRTPAPWNVLHASRLWITAAMLTPLPAGDDLASRIIAGLGARQVRETLVAMTNGPVRYRLAFSSGHRRGVVWRVAHALADAYVNDPTQTTWEVFVDEEHGMLELTPKRADDPRFAWRVAEVPAASHPTVAAALALAGGARDDDRVWDPFVGSGAELVERARRGAFKRLVGSDLDEAALAAARANLAAAGVAAELVHGDARSFAAGPVDLIVTNPPLGSRVQLDAAALLVTALPHFAKQLAPGGRLVWITPATKKTSPVAERLGLRRTRAHVVDLGGVRGQLERWELAKR